MGDSVKGVRDMRYGIDIRGGVEAVFQPNIDGKPTEEELEEARNVMETRLDNENIDDKDRSINKIR